MITKLNAIYLLIHPKNHPGNEFSKEELVTYLRKPPLQTVVRVNKLITDQCRLKADLTLSLLTVLYALYRFSFPFPGTTNI